MPFLRMILIRLGTSVLTLGLVSMIVFVAVQGLPGDPASRILGREASETAKLQLREELNLDAPLVARYADWTAGLLRGDLGTSFASRKPVAEMIGPRLRNTLSLAGLALLLYVPLSIAAGDAAGAPSRQRARPRAFGADRADPVDARVRLRDDPALRACGLGAALPADRAAYLGHDLGGMASRAGVARADPRPSAGDLRHPPTSRKPDRDHALGLSSASPSSRG